MPKLIARFIAVAFLFNLMFTSPTLAAEPPPMPYAFEQNCFGCHKEPEQTGPVCILDMQTRTGNPLHEQYIRHNARFGLSAMPAFRFTEVSDNALNDIVNYLKSLAQYRKTNPGYKPTPMQTKEVKQ